MDRLRNSFIQSGDDAIALKRTNGALFECLTIYYSHGLSIGSVSLGDVAKNVVFKNIELVGPEHGARIKAKKFELGLVSNVTFEDILVHEANFTSIAIRQDYLDPMPDHMPDTGVLVEHIHFKNFKATVKNRDPQCTCYWNLNFANSIRADQFNHGSVQRRETCKQWMSGLHLRRCINQVGRPCRLSSIRHQLPAPRNLAHKLGNRHQELHSL
ncbi:pectin lyase fold/virulence factor [Protomyces lactucae-debilis]|uniref:Pectin lyase fold/virulence factor n=1 Tax=Protomyces lactucae-debilis TaxID=2754530 RepID=A0A1Y2FGF0_PROLT|nr:pectin lyase fold/virulence factor [Protomyces lactucae-debilis]ORY83020.1 pectin lyase fold/virulence factor [Protomyces lactucae-debilis]